MEVDHRMDRKGQRTKKFHRNERAKECNGGTHQKDIAGEPHVASIVGMPNHATTRPVTVINATVYRGVEISIGSIKPCTGSDILFKSGGRAGSGRHQQSSDQRDY